MQPHYLAQENWVSLGAAKDMVGDVAPPRHTTRFLQAMVSFSETALSSLHIQKSHFRGLRAMKRNFKKQGDKDLSKRFRQLLRSNALPAVLFPREITHMAIVGDGGGASSRTPELPW